MRKIVPVTVVGAVALAASAGTFAYAVADKEVTVSVDGRAETFNTYSRTVEDVLDDRGIKLGAHDEVAPAVDTKVTEGSEIAVQYGRQVTVKVDGEKQTFWTTADSVGDALQSAGMDLADAELSTSRSASIDRDGVSFTADTLKKLKVKVEGKTETIETTAATYGDALEDAKIKVDDNDIVSVDLDDEVDPKKKIEVTKVSEKTKTKTETLEYETIERNTKKLERGETEVKTEGEQGERTIKFKITLHNGKKHDRKEISDEVTKKPVDRVVLIGTKEPEPEPEDDYSNNDDSDNGNSDDGNSSDDDGGNSNGGDDAPSVPDGSVWDRLAQCEAGGDWSINTGNGFYGGLQFTLQTWNAFGGSGMPNNASREEQIRIGKKVQAGQGWGAWPVCSSKLGLR